MIGFSIDLFDQTHVADINKSWRFSIWVDLINDVIIKLYRQQVRGICLSDSWHTSVTAHTEPRISYIFQESRWTISLLGKVPWQVWDVIVAAHKLLTCCTSMNTFLCTLCSVCNNNNNNPVDNFGTVVGENPTPYGTLALWAVNGLSIVYWEVIFSGEAQIVWTYSYWYTHWQLAKNCHSKILKFYEWSFSYGRRSSLLWRIWLLTRYTIQLPYEGVLWISFWMVQSNKGGPPLHY